MVCCTGVGAGLSDISGPLFLPSPDPVGLVRSLFAQHETVTAVLVQMIFPEALPIGTQAGGMLRAGPLSEETWEDYELQLQSYKEQILRFEKELRSEQASVQTGQQCLQDLLACLAEAAPKECRTVPSQQVSRQAFSASAYPERVHGSSATCTYLAVQLDAHRQQ